MGDIYKRTFPTTLFFDTEYVPDLATACRIYKLSPEDAPADVVLHEIYRINGATEEDPVPMLKFMLYRVIAISGLIRKAYKENGQHRVSLNLFSLPKEHENGDYYSEKLMLEKFLNSIGENHPQIVGWAIDQFDLNVLFQRSVINRAIINHFCIRPDRPWDGPDYFNKQSNHFVDLMESICGWGLRSRARLDEMALACGVPGKLGIDGSQVCRVFYNDGPDGWKRIINYCECDVMTTYLLWLDTMLVSGFLTEEEYHWEKIFACKFIEDLVDAGSLHFIPFLEAWGNAPSSMSRVYSTD